MIKYNYGKKDKIEIKLYDEIIYYNLNLLIYAINDFYSSINHSCIWSRMEEGLFSYETDFECGFRANITRKIRQYIKREDAANLVKNYYCYFPELKKKNCWNFIRVPSFKENKKEIINILNEIFNYVPSPVKEKYIFLLLHQILKANHLVKPNLY